MREIKFRAWDKGNKQMSYTFTLAELTQYEHIFERKFPNWLAEFKKLAWMQYTGLKDRNGKESYHNDLVSLFGAIWQIIWDDYYVCYMLHKVTGEHAMKEIPGWNIRNAEVIGNIYENGDLIE